MNNADLFTCFPFVFLWLYLKQQIQKTWCVNGAEFSPYAVI